MSMGSRTTCIRENRVEDRCITMTTFGQPRTTHTHSDPRLHRTGRKHTCTQHARRHDQWLRARQQPHTRVPTTGTLPAVKSDQDSATALLFQLAQLAMYPQAGEALCPDTSIAFQLNPEQLQDPTIKVQVQLLRQSRFANNPQRLAEYSELVTKSFYELPHLYTILEGISSHARHLVNDVLMERSPLASAKRRSAIDEAQRSFSRSSDNAYMHSDAPARERKQRSSSPQPERKKKGISTTTRTSRTFGRTLPNMSGTK
jgi:hypothetical protein